MMLQRLEEEHIRAYLQDELTDPIFTHPAGGIKLMVHESQAGRAMELVDKLENLYREAMTCSQCGSHNVHLVNDSSSLMGWLSTLLARLRGRSVPTSRNYYRCYDCAHEFDEQVTKQEDTFHPFRAGIRNDQQN